MNKKKNLSFFFNFLISLCITGFGRPSDIPYLGFLSATVGYALFWNKVRSSSPQNKLLWLWLLYALSSLIQTRWLLSHPYSYIIGIWLFLATSLSFPYTWLTQKWLASNMSLASLCAFASAYTLLDMCEPYLFFSGITFRSIGAYFMALPITSQVITLFGGAGCTFLVILCNGACLRALFFHPISKVTSFRNQHIQIEWANATHAHPLEIKKCSQEEKFTPACKKTLAWFLLPIALGTIASFLPVNTRPNPVTIEIVHTSDPVNLENSAKANVEQYKTVWKKLFSHMSKIKKDKPNLIIFPEGMIPFSAQTALLERHEIPQKILQWFFPRETIFSTLHLLQAASNELNTSLLVGVERVEYQSPSFDNPLYYNSACLVNPHTFPIFYDKRVLVPGGEYMPLEEIFKPILLNYGMVGSFQKGQKSVILHTQKISFFPLICYEEMLSSYVAPAVSLLPDVLVSISNDHWFPCTLFANEHWMVGKMRAMEYGFELLRCSNMGKSGLINSKGQEIASSKSSVQNELLVITFQPERRWTPFSWLKEKGVAMFFGMLFLFSFWYTSNLSNNLYQKQKTTS